MNILSIIYLFILIERFYIKYYYLSNIFLFFKRVLEGQNPYIKIIKIKKLIYL